MAEAYISQFYSYSTGDTITAARLNGNITNLISGLQDGDKAINVLKVLGASQQFITADGSNITMQNIDTYSGKDTITIHKAENDGNPALLLGAGTAERFELNTIFDTGAQTLDYVEFQTKAASATADKGEFRFIVDETLAATIDDGGIEIKASGSLSFGAVDILSDSAGTTTLSNIDAIDATTEATIEAGIDTLNNLTSVGALNAGSITSGFGSIDNGASTITTTGLVTGGSLAFTTAINSVTATELSQLETIGTTTISAAQWGYVGGFDQALASSNSVIFNNVQATLTIAAQPNITSLGTLTSLAITGDLDINTNKFNVAGASGNTLIAGTLGITGLVTLTAALTNSTATLSAGSLTGLTAVNGVNSTELSQLETIGTTTISAPQWGYLGALNQELTTTSDVEFNKTRSQGSFRLGGADITMDSSGHITPTSSFHLIKTYEGASTDDIILINGTFNNGEILVLTPFSPLQTVVVKNNSSIHLAGSDFSMSDEYDVIVLMYFKSAWIELSRASNSP